MCRIDDADFTYQVLQETTPIARKPHHCGECGRIIQPGERYERLDAIGERRDGVVTEKTCAHCLVARSWLRAECGGWIYRMVCEDLREHFYGGGVADRYWVGRMVIGMQRRWHGKKGLMSIPKLK